MDLGVLKEIDIRAVWKHEQYDFSAWLAEDANIKHLSDTLHLSLTDVETEKFVGNYRCDIICQDELTGKNVLIENQLEPSNHDHLGKIITYASGLDASIVIWIVQEAREEHASAIEWLNKHTSDDLSFFLIEIHAYQIGDSKPAPMFKIIEQPNDFAKQVKAVVKALKCQSLMPADWSSGQCSMTYLKNRDSHSINAKQRQIIGIVWPLVQANVIFQSTW